MENSAILFLIFAVVLIIIAVIAVAVGYLWASSTAKDDFLKRLKDQGDAINKQAQEQLQGWKDQELNLIRQQIHDAAKGQAIQEMQSQMQKWQETEFQLARQQISEAARGQAVQEMQDQLKKWQENELVQIRERLYDAARGQATQEMQVQMQKWQETELQQARLQMLEGVRGEAIKEAQDQLVKWRTEEMEKAKSQIWDVLSKEANVTLEQWKVETEREIRRDAIDKSQSVTMGKMTEHLVPYLPGFEFNPSDARFIGSPIDLVVFDGLGNDEVKKIVFVEIKTGSSTLSTRERLVRDAILARNVEWKEIIANLESPEVVQEKKSRRRNNTL